MSFEIRNSVFLPSPKTEENTGEELLDNEFKPLHCLDCHSVFTSNKRLSRHFKTKTHISMLCSLGKLPLDFFEVLEKNPKKHNDLWMNAIDTTDYDSALQSLWVIFEILRSNAEHQNFSQQKKSYIDKLYSSGFKYAKKSETHSEPIVLQINNSEKIDSVIKTTYHNQHDDGVDSIFDESESFRCSYCNIEYRTHGLFGRHLKSKLHITTLGTIGLLPPLILYSTDKYNTVWLDDMDTTDSKRALESLLDIIDKLRPNEQIQEFWFANYDNNTSKFFIHHSPTRKNSACPPYPINISATSQRVIRREACSKLKQFCKPVKSENSLLNLCQEAYQNNSMLETIKPPIVATPFPNPNYLPFSIFNILNRIGVK